MGKFDVKKTMPRYKVIAWLFIILAITIVGKAAYIMTVKKAYWTEVADRLKVDSASVAPNRGNILSSDGQLLASSLPEYELFIDFNAMQVSKTDTLWDEKVDSICQGLNHIFPQKSVDDFRKHLEAGRAKNSKHWKIWDRRVNYSTFSEVSKLPLLKLPQYKSGFHVEVYNARRRPYGSLASRTIGDMFGAIDSARCGLELYYDSTLRGENGLVNRRKVLAKYLNIMIKEPVDGADIVTTIDVNMQDLAERAVIDELKAINGELGVAIVMETRTGDVKALVNMSRLADGNYAEIKNNAVSDLVEPGSVFKTASMMVALEDGKCDTLKKVDCTGGIYKFYDREMKDHNWRRGGYGVLSFSHILYNSSNIGVSRIINQYYSSNPQEYIDGLRRLGFGLDFDLPFVGAAKHARILGPKERKQVRGAYWSKTTLPWMSIGYETQIPPIFMVAFYNAIANGGRLMQPRFVKQIVKNGEVIKDYAPVCLKEHIASDKTLDQIRNILHGVVHDGTGKHAGNKLFDSSGKTGTAQIADGSGYGHGGMKYWLSFCGFFPSEDPQYTCIVCIKKSGLPASGGLMCGQVFHDISMGIMADKMKTKASEAHDTASVAVPKVKNGNILAADYVLRFLKINTVGGWNGSYATGNPIWGSADTNKESVTLKEEKMPSSQYIPDVHGMGARDAVFILENSGVKVRLSGCGHVIRQSIAPNTKITKGMTMFLELS